MKILFWNLNNQNLVHETAELVHTEHIDFMAFSETNVEFVEKIINILELNYNKVFYFHETPGCNRIKVVSTLKFNEIMLLNQHKYYSLMLLNGNERPLIIGMVHFPSKRYHSPDEIRRAFEILHTSISHEEEIHGVNDSLIVGDFNVDPFEMPMVSFTGMCATNATDCIARDIVTRAEEGKRLFYNPMWSLYSVFAQRPGTHKYSRFGEDVIRWHFVDQVIIRPSLIDAFKFNSLKLISGTKVHKYTNKNGVPNLSDHLPIACEVEL